MGTMEWISSTDAITPPPDRRDASCFFPWAEDYDARSPEQDMTLAEVLFGQSVVPIAVENVPEDFGLSPSRRERLPRGNVPSDGVPKTVSTRANSGAGRTGVCLGKSTLTNAHQR